MGMKEITYNNIADTLLEEFQEYKLSQEYDEKDKEFQYATMGGFGRFLTQAVESESANEELIQKVFDFINQIYNGSEISNDDHSDTLQNLLYVEVFENLAQIKSGVEAAREYLQDKAKNDFENIFQHTGVEDN